MFSMKKLIVASVLLFIDISNTDALSCRDLPALNSFSLDAWVDRLRYTIESTSPGRCQAVEWTEEIVAHPSHVHEHDHEKEHGDDHDHENEHDDDHDHENEHDDDHDHDHENDDDHDHDHENDDDHDHDDDFEHDHSHEEHMIFTVYSDNQSRKGHAVNAEKRGHFKLQWDNEDFSMYVVVVSTDYDTVAMVECSSEWAPVNLVSIASSSSKTLDQTKIDALKATLTQVGVNVSGMKGVQHDDLCTYN